MQCFTRPASALQPRVPLRFTIRAKKCGHGLRHSPAGTPRDQDSRKPNLKCMRERRRLVPGSSGSAKENQRRALEDTAALRVGTPSSPTMSHVDPDKPGEIEESTLNSKTVASDHSDSDPKLPVVTPRSTDDLF
ncbi:hypothetical protein NDU88_001456 [Pleurodeles waltl]|uniref:Uncharacterized protein n=1 Tax=Pleurodeles waltl TaxID=8319 RepID=A0AAV7PB82_PLEWA|nr:hypothetical protein NDU88_001456 [Pleurodeles waltl]